MPSKNMIRKGKRRQTVKPAYRAHRDALRETEAQALEAARLAEEAQAAGAVAAKGILDSTTPPEPAEAVRDEAVDLAHEELFEEGPEDTRHLIAGPALTGKRLDAALVAALPEISRARAQLLIGSGQVLVDGKPAKASLKLAGGERVVVQGDPQPAPLRAEPEDIPLRIVYEDADLAVIDKPAGMLVHAGAGDAAHNRGTLVNALLFHFQQGLSREGGALRPGIVHRLDKDTSGLILVAKNDRTHQRLATLFEEHDLRKAYVALVHGTMRGEEGTVDLPVGRDTVRRTRMTTRRSVEGGARPAVSHWRVRERLDTPFGPFTLLEVEIETGRTHQIRVHLAALGHAVVGDTLYGAPAVLRSREQREVTRPTLDRNFLHAAELELAHPRTGKPLRLQAPLPGELTGLLEELRSAPTAAEDQPPSRVARIQAE